MAITLKHRNSKAKQQNLAIGLEKWHEGLLLVSVLLIVGALLLGSEPAEQHILHLLHWLGNGCSWCNVSPV